MIASGRVFVVLAFWAVCWSLPRPAAAFHDAGVLPLPHIVTARDLNGDGHVDLLVGNAGFDNVAILLGDGTGAFTLTGHLPVDTAPRGIKTADLNGDGHTDLVVVNFWGYNPLVFLGDGRGGFTVSGELDGDLPVDLSLGDFTGDGRADLVITERGGSAVSAFKGDGLGRFQVPPKHLRVRHPLFVVSGDFNGDAKLDIAVSTMSRRKSLIVLLGDGAGGFTLSAELRADGRPGAVAAGDVDGNGTLDLLLVAEDKAQDRVYLLVFLGDGSGRFTLKARVPLGPGNMRGPLALADFNEDGRLDVAVAMPNGRAGVSRDVLVLLGDGAGGFGPPMPFRVGLGPYAVAVADFNGDGHVDIAVSNRRADSVSVLLGDGTGAFAKSREFSTVTPFPNGPLTPARSKVAGRLSFAAIVMDHPEPQEAPTRFGTSLGIIGDVNGDGVADIAVGAPFQDTGPPLPNGHGTPLNVGKLFVLSGVDRSVILAIDEPDHGPVFKRFAQFAKFGRVAPAGDVDNDGVPDILVSSYFKELEVDDSEHDGAGQAFVVSGADGHVIHTLNDPVPQTLARFGFHLAGLGDVNGDGVPDVLISAPFNDVNGIADAGQAFVFSGADGSVLRTLTSPTPRAGAKYGFSVGAAGDLDGDGIPDLIIGAPGENRVYLVSGSNGRVIRLIDSPVQQAQAFFGGSVVGGGDVDGDGVRDIFVGAPLMDDIAGRAQGKVFVFSGADDRLIRMLSSPNPQPFARFGWSLAPVDDLDGDGVADIFVGAPDQDAGGLVNVGKAFVFSGADGSVLASLDSPIPQPFGGFGLTVASADLNGDGVPDLLVGAPYQDSGGHLDQGQVFVFLSEPAGARGR